MVNVINHSDIGNEELHHLLRTSQITMAGHKGLKIYGTLTCWSGKVRMAKANRVFFSSESQAKENGFRPCGHCMKNQYKAWKGGR